MNNMFIKILIGAICLGVSFASVTTAAAEFKVPVADIPPLPTYSGPTTPLLAAWTQFVRDPSTSASASTLMQVRFVRFGMSDCSDVSVHGDSGTDPIGADLRGTMQGTDPVLSSAWRKSVEKWEEGGRQGLEPSRPINFLVGVCVADLPNSWTKVEIRDRRGAVMPVYPSGELARLPGPAKIAGAGKLNGVVMVDTGCRGKVGSPTSRSYQDCKTGWHFPGVIENIMDEANQPPHFVLHAGDYHYFFEDEHDFWNPVGRGSYDRFEYWLQEFFVAAQPLLMASPWVLGRGNHELCISHKWFGEGWHVLFSNMKLTDDNGDRVRPCYDADPSDNGWIEPTWAIDLKSDQGDGKEPYRIVVIDASKASSSGDGYKDAAKLTASKPERNVLWLSHYPATKVTYFRGAMQYGDRHILADFAATTSRPKLYFSGHQHFYQDITWSDPAFARANPRLIIVGNSGTKLDATGLPGGDRGNTTLSCYLTMTKGFAAGKMAHVKTAKAAGYVRMVRDSSDPSGWKIDPVWTGGGSPPDFPPSATACDEGK